MKLEYQRLLRTLQQQQPGAPWFLAYMPGQKHFFWQQVGFLESRKIAAKENIFPNPEIKSMNSHTISTNIIMIFRSYFKYFTYQ